MGTVTVPLTQDKFAIIDEEDAERVLAHKWYAARRRRTWYAGTNIGTEANGDRKTIQLHRFIMNPAPDMEVDHRNGDGLDNRRANLRECPPKINATNQAKYACNKSGYKGVTWRPDTGIWRATIKAGGRSYSLGQFVDRVEAARAYDAAARQHFGEFARLNFPD